MERINSNNYEAFFLDYMEGNLTAQQEFELMDFLDRNPDLKAELDMDFGDVTLQPVSADSFDKSGLKKVGIQPEEVDELMIASVEGQLSLEATTDLNKYVEANNLSTSYKYYQSTILKADLSEGYGNKSDLKKKDRFFVPFWGRVAAVAGIGAIIIGVSVTQFNSEEPINKHENNAVVTHPTEEENNFVSNDVVVPVGIVEDEVMLSNDASDGTTYESGLKSTDQDPLNNSPYEHVEERNDVEVPSDEQPTLEEETQEDFDKELNTEDDGKKSDPLKEEDANPEGEEKPLIDPEQKIKSRKEHDEEKSKIITEEPIKVVTNFAEKVFKKDVSYERDTDTSNGERVKHHFKLGKFEFERKKR